MRKIIAIPDLAHPERCEIFHYADEGVRREWVNADALKVLVDEDESIFAIRGISYSLINVEAPKMSRHKLKKALPFIAEPFCARPIEDCHFTLVGVAEGVVTILVIEKKQMDSYFSYFEGCEITPSALVPLSFLIREDIMPCELMTDSGIYLAIHSRECYVYGLSEREAFLKSLGDTAYPVIDCLGEDEVGLAKMLCPKTSPNVLHGEYRIVPTSSPSRIRVRLLLGVAIVLGVVLIGEKVMIKNRYQEKLASQHNAIAKIYHQHFPNATSVVSPLYRMRQLLKQQNISYREKAFFEGMQAAAAVLPLDVAMQSVDYRHNHLVLTFARSPLLNQSLIEKELSAHGYRVQYQTIQKDGLVFVRLTLEGRVHD